MDIGEVVVNQEDEYVIDDWAVDDITGKMIEVEKVNEARKEEIGFMKELGVFERSTREECVARTRKSPITTRWIDTNKGTEENPVVRSRLVARDFKKKGEMERYDLFAAMPPLEAKRM